MMRKINSLVGILTAIAIFASGCVSVSTEPPRNAEVIQVVASTNLQSWIDEAAQEFNRLKEKSPQDKSLKVLRNFLPLNRIRSAFGLRKE